MDFQLNQVFENVYPPEAAVWCNENNAYIEEIASVGGKKQFQIMASPEPSIAERKTAKSNEVKANYLNYRSIGATVPSSLGFTADANTRAWTDVMGLVTKAQSTPDGDKITFRAADNTFHEITRDQLSTLLLEIIATGEDSYAQKWKMDRAIEAAQTKDELDAIDTTFKSPTTPFVFVAPTDEELTPEQKGAKVTRSIQSLLDTTAQKLGYDSCLSVCSYVDTGVTKFDEEGDAFRKWRSAVWAKGYEIVAAVQAGTREIPTEEELFAELPKIELDREELAELTPTGTTTGVGIPTIGI